MCSLMADGLLNVTRVGGSCSAVLMTWWWDSGYRGFPPAKRHEQRAVKSHGETWTEKTTGRQVFRRRQWHPTPVLLLGKSHGQRSLVGCIGEGNGNPLQCSCLENPRDGGAWWAAVVYGVAQSQTRLKWLSSSSSRQVFALMLQTQIGKVLKKINVFPTVMAGEDTVSRRNTGADKKAPLVERLQLRF